MLKRREGVMLAIDFNPAKHGIGGQCMSVKLDGQRVWWDGGISLGLDVTKVPWAHNPKCGLVSTGLWTRGFKTVQASRKFVAALPRGLPLDGEVWLGNGRFEELESIARTEVPGKRWDEVKYCCFDSPSYEMLFKPGNLYIRKEYHTVDCWNWVRDKITNLEPDAFARASGSLKPLAFEVSNSRIPLALRLEQTRLPLREEEAVEALYAKLNEVTDAGGEGVMIRSLSSIWNPSRDNCLLKVKKFYDAEATVVGYQAGAGRLTGTLGALELEGLVPVKVGSTTAVKQRFQISGFTDEERKKARELFPVGTLVTYRYNEITNDGVPRFARYWRKRNAL